MSSEVNITRFVATILKEKTTVYSPLIEAIVNSIEAIQDTNRLDGKITITPIRKAQISFDADILPDTLPDIVGFSVEDNGIGFNDDNRKAFNTMFTDYKRDTGGMGVGRFIFLKYFKKVKISSTYKENDKYHKREFKLGSNFDIIEDEKDQEIEATDIQTIVSLDELSQQSYDKELDTVARKILERILVFFVDDSFKCPTIALKENDRIIVLNDLLASNQEIRYVRSENFLLGFKTPGQKENFNEFQVKIYKITYPSTTTSKLYLTAHHRVVTDTSISKYIPEFKEEFVDIDGKITRIYRIVAYVSGNYLDDNVTAERGTFNFPLEVGDVVYPFSQQVIERKSADIVANQFKDQVQLRRKKRYDIVQKYVDDSAPWNKTYLKDLDLKTLPYDLDEQSIESALQLIKFDKERAARGELKRIIDNPKTELFAKASKLVELIQQAGISDLTHYIAFRKVVLEYLRTLLKIKDDGKYNKEKDIHDIIFPRKTDSEVTSYEDHNLWILDEKLNYSEYVSSDKAIDTEAKNFPDLLILFNKRMAYRMGNEKSNPITIFEFKQPQRDDFASPSAKEDPIGQIIRYTSQLKEGKYKTPEGRDIYADKNTPVYGYLICDLTSKVTKWLFEKDFTAMPDGLGYYQWHYGLSLYIEVLAWDKILNDAEQRNKIFFKKLGLT